MDPNSAHQIWSLWTWEVRPSALKYRPLLEIRENVARFARKAFGSATQLRLNHQPPLYRIEIRTEGAPLQDSTYVEFMAAQWRRFFETGFGVGTEVGLTTRLLAGSTGDGRPAEQLIILPAWRQHG